LLADEIQHAANGNGNREERGNGISAAVSRIGFVKAVGVMGVVMVVMAHAALLRVCEGARFYRSADACPPGMTLAGAEGA
jgi:hypothetical protein